MSDPVQEQGKGTRSTKTKRFKTGVGLATLFFGAAANITLLLFLVPKIEQIYQDALPGLVLPPLTQFIITARIAIVFIVLGWPILGTILLRLQKPYAILWINLGILWSFLQVVITVYALF